jgi:undecaprenyl-diphosphatase
MIQGLTEFLPISSSAHLIIVPWLFGWEPFGLAFDIALHVGTLLAIIGYFWREFLQIGTALVDERGELRQARMPVNPMARLGIFIAIATIPAALIGVLGESAIDRTFHDGSISDTAIIVIAVVLIALGILLAIADRRSSASNRPEGPAAVTLRDAVIIGFAQSFALIPGASRSGSTITAGLFVGMSRPDAARFSFLLGVPLILGAGLKKGIDLTQEGVSGDDLTLILVGMASAAAVGYLAIAGLLRFLRTRSTDIFALYRLGLGLTLIALVIAGVR